MKLEKSFLRDIILFSFEAGKWKLMMMMVTLILRRRARVIENCLTCLVRKGEESQVGKDMFSSRIVQLLQMCQFHSL